MPARNSVKTYVDNGYYHIYNRGVNKLPIFPDPQDEHVFLSYIKEYLSLKDEKTLREQFDNPHATSLQKDKILKTLRMKNYHQTLQLLAFSLMKNHFHLFVQQTEPSTIFHFMQSLCTRFTMYINRKYRRVGPLFQSKYKAVLVTSEPQFLHLSRYIHKQAMLTNNPSSLPDYLGLQKTPWIHPEDVLSYFSKSNPKLSYEAFVKESEEQDTVKHFMIEDD